MSVPDIIISSVNSTSTNIGKKANLSFSHTATVLLQQKSKLEVESAAS